MEGERIMYPEIDSSSEGGSISSNMAIVGDYLFVAVGQKFEENESTVIWAFQNSGRKKICILHVHTPAQSIELGKTERNEMLEALDKYTQLCAKAGVSAQKLFIEADSIEKGIVTLISQNMIRKLVMGAVRSDYRSYLWVPSEIKSKKAKYVNENAPGYCQISFVYNNVLIQTREATVQNSSPEPHVDNPISFVEEPVILKKKIAMLEKENNRISKELQDAQYNYFSLDKRIVKELEQNLASTMQLAKRYKKELDDMQQDRGNPIMFCLDFPSLEIQSATNGFDPSRKIGEDTYGNIYKGVLRHTEVAIKIPHPDIPQEFRKEVEILCKMRHPNIVNLIGICTESHVLIYEHCIKGTLGDQLNNINQGSSFSWRIRLRIATDLYNILTFLHSHKPNPLIHGDLRPENIHLDSNYTCKLNGFRINDSDVRNYLYMDPEFFAGGDLTTKSDVYAFGVILLQLLTGKQAVRLARQVQNAVENDELSNLLDTSAEWPLEQAKQLAELALRCCEMTQARRPDLEEDIWKEVLESFIIL